MRITTPVALIIFNRPEYVRSVLDAIEHAKPPRLYVIADGPRTRREGVACEEARNVLNNVNWECDVKMNYSEVNMGCRFRISSGLDWVFKNEEEAIILEDDCIPSRSFFKYCEILLNYYRNEDRVFTIGGTNYQNGAVRTGYSYYFSRFAHCWGWAAWRRSWDKYDIKMEKWPEIKEEGLKRLPLDLRGEKKYWIDVFDRTHSEALDTWAFQLLYSGWIAGALSIIPEKNMVSNIGFGKDATRTHEKNPYSNMKKYEIEDIVHPPIIERNITADRYTYLNLFAMRWKRRERVKRILGSMKSFGSGWR